MVDYTAIQTVPAGSIGSSGVTVTTSPTPAIDDLDLFYRGETRPYYWRIEVYDESDTPSGWFYPPGDTVSPGDPLPTPRHPWPWPEFTWLPVSPNAQEEIQFDGRGKWCYNPAMKDIECPAGGYHWDFGDSVTFDDNETSTHAYLNENEYAVTLEITDARGYTCSKTHSLNIGLPLPEWIEIPPITWLRNFLATISNFFSF